MHRVENARAFSSFQTEHTSVVNKANVLGQLFAAPSQDCFQVQDPTRFPYCILLQYLLRCKPPCTAKTQVSRLHRLDREASSVNSFLPWRVFSNYICHLPWHTLPEKSIPVTISSFGQFRTAEALRVCIVFFELDTLPPASHCLESCP